MTAQNKNVPSLRFSGFDGDWDEKMLEDITSWASGGTPSKDNPSYWNGNIPWISASSMRGFEYSDSKLKLTDEGLKNGSRLAEKGSMLILVRGSMLFNTIPVGIATRDVSFNQDVKSIKCSNETTSKYLLFWLVSQENKLLNMVVGTGIGAGKLELNDLKQLPINLPTLAEQQKITAFLTAVDEKIQLLTKKKALLEQYKKGVMQKIFNQEIRFKDDNENDFADWEEKKGNEVFDSISNKNHNSDLPILAITQEYGAIPRDLIDYQISVTDKSVESYKVVEVGDFIISLRSFQGGIEYSNYKGICSPAYIILRSKVSINDLFYKYYLKTDFYIQQMNAKLEGIRDGKMVSYKYFSEIGLPFPSLEEQNKIAGFFVALDTKINSVNLQLDKTKQYKKGLLQQMFV